MGICQIHVNTSTTYLVLTRPIYKQRSTVYATYVYRQIYKQGIEKNT